MAVKVRRLFFNVYYVYFCSHVCVCAWLTVCLKYEYVYRMAAIHSHPPERRKGATSYEPRTHTQTLQESSSVQENVQRWSPSHHQEKQISRRSAELRVWSAARACRNEERFTWGSEQPAVQQDYRISLTNLGLNKHKWRNDDALQMALSAKCLKHRRIYPLRAMNIHCFCCFDVQM